MWGDVIAGVTFGAGIIALMLASWYGALALCDDELELTAEQELFVALLGEQPV